MFKIALATMTKLQVTGFSCAGHILTICMTVDANDRFTAMKHNALNRDTTCR
ncbi:hypothetical protein SSYIS1_02070 [Serratia symbiotica]|uniref:Uncharacterized protein n=1 Tax=Serratia symbiotica TaxID=138074 RepID=A0A455VDS2_9GAMM|nr:hypothetical protein SSYIS1_02070 [Serratia symbiotica]